MVVGNTRTDQIIREGQSKVEFALLIGGGVDFLKRADGHNSTSRVVEKGVISQRMLWLARAGVWPNSPSHGLKFDRVLIRATM